MYGEYLIHEIIFMKDLAPGTHPWCGSDQTARAPDQDGGRLTQVVRIATVTLATVATVRFDASFRTNSINSFHGRCRPTRAYARPSARSGGLIVATG